MQKRGKTDTLTLDSASYSCQGPTGKTGPTGPTGPTGKTGASGASGATGKTGPAGPTGPTGRNGTNGTNGSSGPTGPAGPQGIQGPVGPQGSQGIQGSAGPQGEQGPQGPQGLQGIQGPQGDQGIQGIAGPIGPQGPTGPIGPINSIPSQSPATGGILINFLSGDSVFVPAGPTGPTGSTAISNLSYGYYTYNNAGTSVSYNDPIPFGPTNFISGNTGPTFSYAFENGMSVDNSTKQVTIQNTGTYEVHFRVYGIDASATGRWSFSIYQNSTELIQSKVCSSNQVSEIQEIVSFIIGHLNSGDTISLVNTSHNNVTVQLSPYFGAVEAQLMIKQIV